jgi:dihydroflavonol-4-reductase
LIDGGASLADALDVATVMIAAAEKGSRGDRYIAAGSLAPMTDIAREVEKASGVKAPTLMMPSWFALSIANLSEKWSGLTGSKNPMPPAGIRTLMEKSQLSSAKAEQELGATFRPLGETIKDTVAWYKSHPHL